MLNVRILPVGALEVNCYLVWEATSMRGIVIDPGDEDRRVCKAIDEIGMAPLAIFLTHGHVDHIRGVRGVAERYRIPTVLDPAERDLYFSPQNALPPWIRAAEGLPEPVARLELPELVVEPSIIRTPGHTRGGRCIHFPGAGLLFSGDTLFRGSVGRTDLPGGDSGQLLASIREKLLTLDPATTVYPGHGPSTTIADERENNPFL